IVSMIKSTEPHIVLLHIGTNDMYMGDPGGAPGRLSTLLDHLVAAWPNTLLVVSNIIPLASGGGVTTFNAAVPGIVKKLADAGKHVVFVDQYMGFPTSELGDGVHPNQMGYSRMAEKWFPAISAYLP